MTRWSAGPPMEVRFAVVVVSAVIRSEQLARVGRDACYLLGVLGQERVVVDDLHLGLEEHFPKVRRHEVALAEVVVIAFRVQDTETVADRDAWGHHQEALGETSVPGGHHLVYGLPGDDHGHHDGLPGPGGHLDGCPRQAVVVDAVLRVEAPAVVGGVVPAGDLSQEDHCLGRLTLAEQHRLVARGRPGSPVREQLSGVGRHAVPVARPPELDLAAAVVDQRVLLPPLASHVEVQLKHLWRPLAALSCRRHRDVGLARPAPLENFARRAVRADLEVPLGRVVRRVDDRVAQIRSRHDPSPRFRIETIVGQSPCV